MYRAMIFDMDGLMLDTETISFAAWEAGADEMGMTVDDAFIRSTIGRTMPDIRALVREQLKGPVEALIEAVERHYLEMITHPIDLKTGLVELLDELDTRKLPRAVATSSERAKADTKLGDTGLRDRFDVLVTGDEVENGKPAPDIFLEAAKRLSMEPGDCLVLEDSNHGVESAHRAGMDVIMVPDYLEPTPESRSRTVAVVETLHDVLGFLDRA